MSVGYAPWAMPIGQLHCSTQFTIEAMETCPVPMPVNGNMPPQVLGRVAFETDKDTHLDGDLKPLVADPDVTTLTFKLLPLYGPKHGKLVLHPSGAFDYDPAYNYVGPDNFFASASDGINPPLVFEVIIGVGIPSDDVPDTPHVSVVASGVQIDQRYFTVSFPVKVSPAAQLCEVWRLTVLQGALDCDCTCYARSDCFDIKIVKC